MDGNQFEKAIFDYLVEEKAYPKDELVPQASIGGGTDRNRSLVDIAIIDSRRSEIISLVEAKNSRDRRALRSAVSQLLHYRRQIGKEHIPLYLFIPPSSESGRLFQICQVLPDGNTKDIYSDDFPTYDALVSADKSGKKATQTSSVKATVDTFRLTCVILSIVVLVLLALDITDVLQLTPKQLTLAAIAGGLLVLPFAAKLKMLGIEFERHKPSGKEP